VVGFFDEALKKVKFKPFKICIDHIGVFPEKGGPRAVWVGFKGNKEIISLQRNVEDALRGLFPKDERFHPHITIARVKHLENKKLFKEKAENIRIEEHEFAVDRFILMKSTLAPAGPVHEALEEYSTE